MGGRGECQWVLLDSFFYPAALQHEPSRSEPAPHQGRRAGAGWTLQRAGAGAEGHFSSPSPCPCPAWDGASPSPTACLAVTPPAQLQSSEGLQLPRAEKKASDSRLREKNPSRSRNRR